MWWDTLVMPFSHPGTLPCREQGPVALPCTAKATGTHPEKSHDAMVGSKAAYIAVFLAALAVTSWQLTGCSGAAGSPSPPSTGAGGSGGGGTGGGSGSGGGTGGGSGGGAGSGGGSGSGSTAPAQYVYVLNAVSNNLSAFQLSATDGTLTAMSGSPFSLNMSPRFMAAQKNVLLLGGFGANGGSLSLYKVNSGNPGLLSTVASGVAGVALDASATSAYSSGGESSNPNATLSAFSIANGKFVALAGSPYSFTDSAGNPIDADLLQVDPDGKFVYASLNPSVEHTPYGLFGVIIRKADGSLAGFATGSPQGGCIGGGGALAVAAQTGGNTFVYQSCSDNDWTFKFTIGARAVNQTTGAISGVPEFAESTYGGLAVGLAVDPTGKWLAATDVNNNMVHILAINPATGALSESANHVFPTGNRPNAVSFDRSGKYLYVTNGDYLWSAGGGSNNLSGYAFDPASGTLKPLPDSPYNTAKSPVSIVVMQP